MNAREAPNARASLSVLLRRDTSAKHRLAEGAPFVRSLFSGRVPPHVYARFLQSLYFVYREMEAALDRHRSAPILSQLDMPELRRLPSLAQDVAWWSGTSWLESTSPSPATRTYVGRVREVADSSPSLLVGHLYTRYLGDLSGGQLVGCAVKRAFRLSHAGMAFYRFGTPVERARLKHGFRARLDDLPVDAETSTLIVAEACRAFDYNTSLFEELASDRGGAG
jgi:heme oxygenase (biliverdin-producing, ferredoxin)